MKSNTFVIKHAKKYWYYYLFLVLLSVIVASLGIAFALLLRLLIDETKNGYSEKLMMYGLFLLGFLLLQIICQFTESWLLIQFKGKTRTHFQTVIFKNMLDQNMLAEHSGSYLNILTSDVSYLTDGVCYIVPKAALSLTKFIGAFIAIGLLDYWVLVYIAVLGLVVVVCHYLYKKFLGKFHQDYQNKEAKSRAFMQEVIANHGVIKTFDKNHWLLIEHESRLDSLYKSELKKASVSLFANLSLSLGLLIAYGLIIVYGALKLANGSSFYDASFTFGSLTAIMSLFTQLQAPITSVADLNHRYVLMKESEKRVLAVLKEETKAEAIKKDFTEITLSDFSFSYPDKLVFNHASFTLKKGDLVTIKGASGIGKSTLIKLLLGTIHADRDVLVDGQKASLTPLVSYVPQGNWLLSGTLKDNLTLYDPNIPIEKIEEALRLVELEDFVRDLPEGIDTPIQERAKDISEGQAQRIAIARGILLDKPILLLDEVTSALDSETEAMVLKNLASLGKTLIFVSHKDATNKYCKRVLEINDYQLNEVK